MFEYLILHPREELPELKLTSDVEESAEEILDEYLHGDGNITEITDKVYAMGKAIAIKTVTVQKELTLVEKINSLMESSDKAEGWDEKT